MRWTFKYSEHSLCAEAHFRTERLEVDAAIVDAHLLELLHHCAHEAHGSADVDLSVLCIFEVLFVQEAFSFAEFDFEVSALFPDCSHLVLEWLMVSVYAAVDVFAILAAGHSIFCHGHHRCCADAARDEQQFVMTLTDFEVSGRR